MPGGFDDLIPTAAPATGAPTAAAPPAGGRVFRAPDGSLVPIADGTSPAQVQNLMETTHAQVGGGGSYTEAGAGQDPQGFDDLVPQPKSDFMTGFTDGFLRPGANAINWLGHVPIVSQGLDGISRLVNHGEDLGSVIQDGKNYLPEQAAKGLKPGFLGSTVGSALGALPALAAGAALPEAAAGFAPALVGGVSSGLATRNPDNPWAVAGDTALGAVSGVVGDKALGFIGSAFAPTVRSDAQALINAGLPARDLTAGQIAGGAAQRIESGLSSFPAAGDMVNQGLRRSYEGLNKTAINRALAGVDQTLPDSVPLGYQAIDHTHQALSNGYSNLLPKLNPTLDGQFWNDTASTIGKAQGALTNDRASQLENIVKSRIADRVGFGGRMDGETFKDIDTQLGQLARKYGRSPDADQNAVGDALSEVQGHLRSNLARRNPQYAPELTKLNTGWANLLRVEKAAGAAGSDNGVFSPAQLDNAVKNLAQGSEYPRGKALMQDLSSPARSVLPPTVPDSGSPYRHALELLVTAGVAKESNLTTIPKIALSMAPGLAAYTKPGQAAVARMLTAPRPAYMQAGREAIDNARPYLGAPLGLIGGQAAAQMLLPAPAP